MRKIGIVLQIVISNFWLTAKKGLGLFGVLKTAPYAIVSRATRFEVPNRKGLIQIGAKSRIFGGKIRASSGKVLVGEHCEIREADIQANKGEIEIGKDCFLNTGCILVSCDHIKIGSGCAFGTNVSIYDHDHIYVREGKQPWNENKTSPIEIGENCWIGSNVIILRGSKIGSNCVIAAGTIVKGSIPAHSMVYQKREICIKDIKE